MRWVFAISLIAFVAVIVTIDAAGNMSTFEGPGITLDESFNVSIGWYLVHEETRYGLGAIMPLSQLEIFGYEGYNPDHPPLGRLILGLSDAIVRSTANPAMPTEAVWSITAARFGAAIVFAVTVFCRWLRHMAMDKPLDPRCCIRSAGLCDDPKSLWPRSYRIARNVHRPGIRCDRVLSRRHMRRRAKTKKCSNRRRPLGDCITHQDSSSLDPDPVCDLGAMALSATRRRTWSHFSVA